jgi:predicted transcriptional regulator
MNVAGRKFIYDDNNVADMQTEKSLLKISDFNEVETSQQLVFTLIKLGVHSNTARCLVCLHVHGPSTSKMLQQNCNIRQPDVSVAIAELRHFKVVKLDSSAAAGRGRPSHIYQLTGTLSECIDPFIEEAQDKITNIVSAIATLENLAHRTNR